MSARVTFTSIGDEGKSDREAAFERVLSDAAALPLRLRVRLLDALKADAMWVRDGLRFSVESVPEYRRAKKGAGADNLLADWIASFTPDDVFFDIGANTGALSLLAARKHQGRVPVFAFEPAFDTFAALVRNVMANGVGGVVTPLPIALFDRSCIAPLYRASLGAGSALHALDEAIDYASRSFAPAAVEPVLTLRLDDLVRWFGMRPPTRIKLDVDGAEYKVLAGGAEVLASTTREVYVELVEADAHDTRPQRVMEFLASRGLTLERIVDHKLPIQYPRVFDGLFVRQSAKG